MKMSDEHFAALSRTIKPLDTADRRVAYLRGDYPNPIGTKDLDERYRWYLYWEATRQLKLDGFALPDSLNDSHIKTALTRIVPLLDKGIERDAAIDLALRILGTDAIARLLEDELEIRHEGLADAAADAWRERNPDRESPLTFTATGIRRSIEEA